MTPNDVAEMLRRDREEWEKLVTVLESHPAGPVHDPESPEGEARHVYAHLARWISNSMDDFEALIEGRLRPAPPEGDDDSTRAGAETTRQLISQTLASGRTALTSAA